MFNRKQSLLETEQRLEAETLQRAQELARSSLDWEERSKHEGERVQQCIDPIARLEFERRFGIKPNIVAHQKVDDTYGPLVVPVFGIEYASLLFQPGEDMTHVLRYAQGEYIYSIGEKALRSAKKIFNHDLVIYDRYPGAGGGAEFNAAGLCSGCGNWASLGHVGVSDWSNNKHVLFVNRPKIDNYEDLARNIELFSESTSGLALDCGTLKIFGFKPRTHQAVINCQNIGVAMDSYNKTNGPSEQEIEESRIRSLRALNQL